jgi:hypothetical protein
MSKLSNASGTQLQGNTCLRLAQSTLGGNFFVWFGKALITQSQTQKQVEKPTEIQVRNEHIPKSVNGGDPNWKIVSCHACLLWSKPSRRSQYWWYHYLRFWNCWPRPMGPKWAPHLGEVHRNPTKTSYDISNTGKQNTEHGFSNANQMFPECTFKAPQITRTISTLKCLYVTIFGYVNIRTDPFATLVPKLPKSGYMFRNIYSYSGYNIHNTYPYLEASRPT